MTKKRGIRFGKSPHFQICSGIGNIAQQKSTCLAIVTCDVQFPAPKIQQLQQHSHTQSLSFATYV